MPWSHRSLPQLARAAAPGPRPWTLGQSQAASAREQEPQRLETEVTATQEKAELQVSGKRQRASFLGGTRWPARRQGPGGQLEDSETAARWQEEGTRGPPGSWGLGWPKAVPAMTYRAGQGGLPLGHRAPHPLSSHSTRLCPAQCASYPALVSSTQSLLSRCP